MKLSPFSGMLVAFVALSLMPAACAVQGPGGRPDETGAGATDDPGFGGTDDSSTIDSGQTSSSSGMAPEPECPYDGPPPIDVTTLPECPACTAGGARCLPNGLVPEDFLDQLADCDEGQKCVPEEFIETQGLFIPETCVSVAGAEGRCLSPCIPQVAEQAALLPQSTCLEHQVCVPCYDPQDGTDTGACSLSCDPGPVEDPVELPKCCSGIGTCVPESAAGAQADQLGSDGCSQDNGSMLCAPDVFVQNPNWQGAERCDTSLLSSILGEQYTKGACLPECLPAVDNFLIQQDGCPENFVCAPCKEPPFGGDSGACDFLANPY